jgi:hypothetical protein
MVPFYAFDANEGFITSLAALCPSLLPFRSLPRLLMHITEARLCVCDSHERGTVC